MNTETEPIKHPFDPNLDDPPQARREGFHMVHNLEIPIITRRSSYPFAEMRLHDAIVFDNQQQLKNALQAARTFRKHFPKFKFSGRKIFRGQHVGKFAIIRIQ